MVPAAASATTLVTDGDEVTLEGYVSGGEVTTIGVTDSVKYPGTLSFERFEYPSRRSEGCQEEMSDVASRVLPALGFDGGSVPIKNGKVDGSMLGHGEFIRRPASSSQ